MRSSDWRMRGALAEPVERTNEEGKSGQMSEQRDAAIFTSMPRTGSIVFATLLAEGWDALQRRFARILWGCTDHKAVGQEPHRHPTARLSSEAPERGLSLGERRHPVRRQEPGEILKT